MSPKVLDSEICMKMNTLSGRGCVFQYDKDSERLVKITNPWSAVLVLAEGRQESANFLFDHYHNNNMSYQTLFRFFVAVNLPIFGTYQANKERIMKSTRRLSITTAMNTFAPYQVTLIELQKIMDSPGGLGHLEHINDLYFLKELIKKNPLAKNVRNVKVEA